MGSHIISRNVLMVSASVVCSYSCKNTLNFRVLIVSLLTHVSGCPVLNVCEVYFLLIQIVAWSWYITCWLVFSGADGVSGWTIGTGCSTLWDHVQADAFLCQLCTWQSQPHWRTHRLQRWICLSYGMRWCRQNIVLRYHAELCKDSIDITSTSLWLAFETDE